MPSNIGRIDHGNAIRVVTRDVNKSNVIGHHPVVCTEQATAGWKQDTDLLAIERIQFNHAAGPIAGDVNLAIQTKFDSGRTEISSQLGKDVDKFVGAVAPTLFHLLRQPRLRVPWGLLQQAASNAKSTCPSFRNFMPWPTRNAGASWTRVSCIFNQHLAARVAIGMATIPSAGRAAGADSGPCCQWVPSCLTRAWRPRPPLASQRRRRSRSGRTSSASE